MFTGDDEVIMSRARQFLGEAANVVVLTGAGISAESGVPTFRGTNGIWRDRRVEELATPEAFARDPRLVWDWYLERRRTVAGCQPNAAHHALAKWAKSKSGVRLVTQNVDGLHEAASHPDVISLHGSLWNNRCTNCGQERQDRSLFYDPLPRSLCCDALERPAIVWFGEEISDKELMGTIVAFAKAAVVLVVGTSGVVAPAADFVLNAARRRKTIIDVNPNESSLPSDIHIAFPAAQALPNLLAT